MQSSVHLEVCRAHLKFAALTRAYGKDSRGWPEPYCREIQVNPAETNINFTPSGHRFMPIDICMHTYTHTQTHLDISEGPTHMSYIYGLGQLGQIGTFHEIVHFGFM